MSTLKKKINGRTFYFSKIKEINKEGKTYICKHCGAHILFADDHKRKVCPCCNTSDKLFFTGAILNAQDLNNCGRYVFRLGEVIDYLYPNDMYEEYRIVGFPNSESLSLVNVGEPSLTITVNLMNSDWEDLETAAILPHFKSYLKRKRGVVNKLKNKLPKEITEKYSFISEVLNGDLTKLTKMSDQEVSDFVSEIKNLIKNYRKHE